MDAILTCDNLQKDFGEERIIKGITLAVMPDTFTAVLGPSGSGKSTFLNMLSGLIRPSGGTIRHRGELVSGLPERQLADWKRRYIGHVFQNYLLLNNLTAEENIRIGLSPGSTPLSFDRIIRILELEDSLKKFPAQLSGGEQQRVAIARAVIKRPDILFCDEATGSLDEANSKKVVKLLHEIKNMFSVTILFTTHNQQIAKTADRVLSIRDGLLCQDRINREPIPADEMEWR